MLPKYSKYEIQGMIRKKIESLETSTIGDIDDGLMTELLDGQSFWVVEHYEAASEILGMELQELTEMLPREPLESISFRAEENTEEINKVVEEVNDIFELLAYQLKIGQSS